ncbi:MAG: hypothetical protein JJ975_02080 [Bacteroidia bacterium]|nr:hypothetical protein [Bacteroidia bacterium]
MKNQVLWILLLFCAQSTKTFAQKKTILSCPWVAEETYFFAKDGRNMDVSDTLVLTPWSKWWRPCCLMLCSASGNTLLADVGLYYNKQSRSTTVKGGLGGYWAKTNTILTLDYHWTPQTKSKQIGLNVLKQTGSVRIIQRTATVDLLRTGFNIGIYKPSSTLPPTPYLEAKLGMITPFGRGHIYAAYRVNAKNGPEYNGLRGWSFGMTTLLTYGY